MDGEIIISAILAVLSGSLGVYYRRTKAVVKETAELLTAVSQAVEDNNITKEELQTVLDEARDVLMAVKKGPK